MTTSPDSLLFKLWLLGFRILSFGAIAMGALATISGAAMATLLLVHHQPAPTGFAVGLSLLLIAVGLVFMVIGIRGSRVRTRDALYADVAQTARDRDRLERWINR